MALITESTIIALWAKIKLLFSNLGIGAPNGLATLDGSGKVPASQLPSYVDDVLEFDTFVDFPATGETGKIYVVLDTNLTYRWSGSKYVEISTSGVIFIDSDTANTNINNGTYKQGQLLYLIDANQLVYVSTGIIGDVSSPALKILATEDEINSLTDFEAQTVNLLQNQENIKLDVYRNRAILRGTTLNETPSNITDITNLTQDPTGLGNPTSWTVPTTVGSGGVLRITTTPNNPPLSAGGDAFSMPHPSVSISGNKVWVPPYSVNVFTDPLTIYIQVNTGDVVSTQSLTKVEFMPYGNIS